MDTYNKSNIYDICVIGGGINGCGIARDMAGQGLKTVLIEKGDLASATSSASSKLIHGGLRYLEYYDFSLVRKALKEREKLLRLAPHIIGPLKLILPYVPHMRPLWMMKVGLWIYDRLGGKNSLPHSKVFDLEGSAYAKGLKLEYKKALSYYDASVDDARLVILNAKDAVAHGADILTYDACISIESMDNLWHIKTASGAKIKARMVINSTGSWVQKLLDNNALGDLCHENLRLVQGSHIVVPQLYEGNHAFILQQDDGRIVFVWPYHGYSAVGTTDLDIGDNPDIEIKITDAERDYLLDVINKYFSLQLMGSDIVYDWAGVRALADDNHKSAKAASRDYKLKICIHDDLPILSIYGGKITTYRVLAKQVGKQICDALGYSYKEWTDKTPLSGGNINKEANLKDFIDQQWNKYPWLPQGLLLRYAKAYGTDMDTFLGKASSLVDLGLHLGCGLYTAEVDYLCRYEFAKCPDDILWRRSKLGLLKNQDLENNLKFYFEEQGKGKP